MDSSGISSTLTDFTKGHIDAVVSNIRLAVLDCNCSIIWVNDKFCDLTRYTRQELVGKMLCDLSLVCLTPEDFSAVRVEISSGNAWIGEVQGVNKAGLEIWVKVNILPIRHRGQEIESYLVFVEDISKAKLALENLEKNEARYRAVVDNQSDFVSLCRVDGTRIFVNQDFCDFMGKRREGIVGTNILKHPLKGIPGHLYERVLTLTKDSPELAGVFQLENSVGKKVWVSISFRGIFDLDGNLFEILTTGRDVTELKTAEINKSKYIDELERIAFLTSHKVRAPISEMQGFMELLIMHAIHSHEWETVLVRLKEAIEKLDCYTRELGIFIYQSRLSK